MNPCELWQGEVSSTGYGYVGNKRRGTRRYAHRAVYEMTYGFIPAGHIVHHECGVKLCVEPTHLKTMTISQHRQEHAAVRCTHARIEMTPRGECRACNREREARRRLTNGR